MHHTRLSDGLQRDFWLIVTRMKRISVLNDVLGPVMRGPSSSHTAAPFFIGTIARALLGEEPATVTLVFDPEGSFAQVYRQQGSDVGFAAGLMGLPIMDERFPQALDLAAQKGGSSYESMGTNGQI
jgi:L-serine dehydratase